MTELHEITQDIVSCCLPDALLSDEDRQMIADHREQLLAIEDDLITMFYDTLYAHPTTAVIFHDGERPERERTLREWWRRTVTAELDDAYFEWIAFIGVVHIRRKVQNPMMLTMFQLVRDMVSRDVFMGLPLDQTVRLGIAFSHLQVTVSAILTEAHTRGYIGALENLAGLKPELTERMLDIEVRDFEQRARKELKIDTGGSAHA